MNRTLAAAVAGLAAGALTVGVASLVAAVVDPPADPFVAIGGEAVDATPGWLKDAAIAAFGTADKLALTIGMVLVIGALAALAGVLALRWWALGAGLVVALGAAGALAAVRRPGSGVVAPLPSVVGTLVGLAALHLLLRRIDAVPPRVVPAPQIGPSRPASAEPSPEPTPEPGLESESEPESAPLPAPPPAASATVTDRRGFLAVAGLLTIGGLVAAVGGRALSVGRRAVDSARTALRLPTPTRAAALPAGVDATLDGARIDGLGPWVTPAADLYRIDTALVVPRVDPATWSLRVHGLVDRELSLSFDELLASPLVEAWITLACVSNPVGGDLVGNGRWLGLPVRDLLARAGPHADADMVLSTSADGFTASTPLTALTDDRDALLAVGMNGEPLLVEHGFPVRLIVPGLFGYVSATKWVTDLKVTRFADDEAYWTVRGWSEQGPVKTQSRIEVPRAGARVRSGQVVVAGTSWAQHRGVVGVEVQVDDDPWVPAVLAADGGIDSWRQWTLTWDATPGSHTLRVRASDPAGAQTGTRTPVVPDGASGWHSIDVQVTG